MNQIELVKASFDDEPDKTHVEVRKNGEVIIRESVHGTESNTILLEPHQVCHLYYILKQELESRYWAGFIPLPTEVYTRLNKAKS